MGLETSTIIAIAASATTTAYSIDQNQKAKAEQKKQQQIQRAGNLAQQQEERRRQIREERIKRARILQSAENTGTAGSSGELGGIGSLATQLSNNIGANLGIIDRANQMSASAQSEASAKVNAGISSQIGQMAPGLITSGASIFSQPDTKTSNKMEWYD